MNENTKAIIVSLLEQIQQDIRAERLEKAGLLIRSIQLLIKDMD